jgi:hypothetical protein
MGIEDPSREQYPPDDLASIINNLPPGFHFSINLATIDTSRFPIVYDRLIKIGLIPKPYSGPPRSIEDIHQRPNIGWEQENCCVWSVPGMVPSAKNDWGIYRVVFRKADPKLPLVSSDHPPMLLFKYCFRSMPQKVFVDNGVFEEDPMRQHIQLIIPILNPTYIVDHESNPINISPHP